MYESAMYGKLKCWRFASIDIGDIPFYGLANHHWLKGNRVDTNLCLLIKNKIMSHVLPLKIRWRNAGGRFRVFDICRRLPEVSGQAREPTGDHERLLWTRLRNCSLDRPVA
jgi:hypothetical protein